jgi:hypothetical protein
MAWEDVKSAFPAETVHIGAMTADPTRASTRRILIPCARRCALNTGTPMGWTLRIALANLPVPYNGLGTW